MKNKKKILCFDIDGVICLTKKNNYRSSKPIIRNIQLIELAKVQLVFSSSLNIVKGKKNTSSNTQAMPSKKFFIIEN